jgi:lipoate-protein ligase A
LDDIAVGTALLAAAARSDPRVDAWPGQGADDELLRLTRPAATLSFSRLDTLAPGFTEAAARARAHGFTPVVRGRGGRAAAYHEGCLLLDHVGVDVDARMRITARFERTSAILLRALAELGVDASVGALPGEYCPGEHSLNAVAVTPAVTSAVDSAGDSAVDPAGDSAGDTAGDGASRRVKVVGTAQRVVRSAWLMSAVVVVDGADALRDVMADVYEALGLDWNPATVGSLAQTVPGTLTTADVHAALLDSYGVAEPDDEVGWTPALLDAARSLADRHTLPARV